MGYVFQASRSADLFTRHTSGGLTLSKKEKDLLIGNIKSKDLTPPIPTCSRVHQSDQAYFFMGVAISYSVVYNS